MKRKWEYYLCFMSNEVQRTVGFHTIEQIESVEIRTDKEVWVEDKDGNRLNVKLKRKAIEEK